MLPNPEIHEVTIHDYIKIVQKRLSLILLSLIIIPTTATIVVFTMKPIYRATASILIEKSSPKITKFEEVYQQGAGSSEIQQYYQTQYKVLSSRSLAEKVFNKLKLSKDPDFKGEKDPLGALHEEIKIEPVRNSQIVLLRVEDIDALRASSIANALAKLYIQQDVELRNRASREAVGFLESQLTGIKQKMQESEEALNKYIQQNRIVTVTDVEKKTDGLLDGLKQTKSKLETEIAELSRRYKAKHPKMIALNAQLEDTIKKIEQETNRLLDLNQKLVQYNLLKKDAESNQQLYTSLLTRAKETTVSEQIEASSIRVVDAANPPEKPFKPKKAQSILISIFMAILTGIGGAFFLEYLDSTIRTAEDVNVYLNMPFLGYIPKTDKETRSDLDRDLVAYQKPKSVVTESYRAIRTSILFASPEDKPLKIILVTSSFPQEGKSFFTVNLSTVFSQVNERVVLLDLDMRRPRLNKVFKVELKNGLTNFLIGTASLEQIIKPTFVTNLSIITAGDIPPNPSELLTSSKIKTLFEELKSKFDRVIVDSPPILGAADTSLLANITDGVILVIKGGSTHMQAALRAKEKVTEARGRILGVVVNNIEPEKEDRYYYYYYYYTEEGKKPSKT